MVLVEGAQPNMELFTQRMGIDLSVDVATLDGMPRLNEDVAFTANDGIHYYDYHQIDFIRGNQLVASRAIADIPAHGYTEPAYFSGGPVGKEEWQRIDLHRGVGELVMGVSGYAQPQIIRLDALRMSHVMLPTDVFYFLRNELSRRSRFTASSVYVGEVDWEQLETEVKRGDMVVAPPGRESVTMPIAFYAEFARTGRP